MKNIQVLLASRPAGPPVVENFRVVEAPIPTVPDGEVLVRHHFLSLDPYMRGRMNDAKSYALPQPLEAVMQGRTVGEVVESRHADFVAGQHVICNGGWQLYSLANPSVAGSIRAIDTSRVPLSAYLGVVGMPGATAWYGLLKLIEPKPGETVVVSAASGAVGGVVGQLAKLRGARAVGIAGGAEKCRMVTDEYGFDACIDYKAHADLGALAAALKEACPNGIDGVFENVGGLCLDAAMLRANAFARVAMCGMIAGYNGRPIPMSYPQLILTNRMRVEGFIISEKPDVWPEALRELGELVASGRIKYRETIAEGIAAAPAAFIGLLEGRNIGKQLVRLL